MRRSLPDAAYDIPDHSRLRRRTCDIDLSRQLAPEDVATIKQAFWDFGVLVFPDQNLTEQQHLDFAAYIGPLEISIAALNKDAKLRIREELADVSTSI